MHWRMMPGSIPTFYPADTSSATTKSCQSKICPEITTHSSEKAPKTPFQATALSITDKACFCLLFPTVRPGVLPLPPQNVHIPSSPHGPPRLHIFINSSSASVWPATILDRRSARNSEMSKYVTKGMEITISLWMQNRLMES